VGGEAPRPAVASRTAAPRADIIVLPLSRGYGGHVVDQDGADYVDLVSCWGANLLGYGHPRIARAVSAQIARFANLGTGSPEYVRLHQLLGRTIPCAEAIHFVKNGSDATAAAVRLARAVTGREMVLHWGYHGVQDWYVASLSCPGVPAALRSHIVTLAALTPERVSRALAAHPGGFACLMVDPMTWPAPGREEMLEIEELVHRDGGLLVLDEVVSGFRVAPGGMQEVWGIKPDLACYGKGIANGLPLAAVVGAERWMSRIRSILYDLTSSCEAVSMVAAVETVQEVIEQDVCSALAAKGRILKNAYAAACRNRQISSRLAGHDARPHLEFDSVDGMSGSALQEILLQELGGHGVRAYATFNLCAAHDDDDLRIVSRALEHGLERVALAVRRRSPGAPRERE
jgi:glutamate-1-semialdehyde 2,1-aminomutase